MKIHLEFENLKQLEEFVHKYPYQLRGQGSKVTAKLEKSTTKSKRRWTKLEDKFLADEAHNKRSTSWLSKRLGRSSKSVNKRFAYLVETGRI